ncbi:MAG: DUF3006 domain-containing protein [Clostridiales bacterium]|jgi:hypothetical protein|nr:DUF3006 domain-containing protein [Clostridiales bacterium]
MIVDRFEGDYAVCEDMETRALLEYPLETLPEGVSVGDVLVLDDCGITVDRVETEARRERVRKMFEDLWG